MTKVLLLASQHGNELLGEQLYEHLQLFYPKYLNRIDFMIANPIARARGLRFIDSDLNRSYKKPAKNYEEKQATKICKYIENTKPAIVLDLHTTTCDQPSCFIISSINNQNINYLKASKINKIVTMSNKIVKNSLIGNCSKAISIEVSINRINANFLNNLSIDIINFLSGVKSHNVKQLFQVYDYLLKSEIDADELRKLQNFKKSKFGFYPILVGEQAYEKDKMYFGFKTEILQIIKL